MKYFELTDYHNTQIISTAELKSHLRITFSDDDLYISELEKAAVRRIEEFTNLFLGPTVGKQYGNTFEDLKILFKSPQLATPDFINKIYYFQNGAWVLLFPTEYQFIGGMKPARIYKSDLFSNPATDNVFNAWYSHYKIGYAIPADVPSPLKQAIKIMVADMYENRQSVIVGKIVSEIPKTAQYLMNPFKILTL